MPRCAQKCRSRLHHAGDYESRSISVLKPRGHYQQIMNENLSVPRVLSRYVMGALHFGPSYGVTIVKPNGVQLQKIADLISEGKVKVIVDKVFPLNNAAAAHEFLEKGHARGKVVLKVQ
ncbi:hypothetical protein CVIRNUC_001996 [Coccomyxa viridis]|uniref:Uncharacterized protein n=1 Tax=Coccomyxa viridis TaxID=1274662 RepID=A0AAV1HX86_9CHLO|nr:hypothetical protein CVIRNUC_001996 [Coccomyxa viridis]